MSSSLASLEALAQLARDAYRALEQPFLFRRSLSPLAAQCLMVSRALQTYAAALHDQWHIDTSLPEALDWGSDGQRGSGKRQSLSVLDVEEPTFGSLSALRSALSTCVEISRRAEYPSDGSGEAWAASVLSMADAGSKISEASERLRLATEGAVPPTVLDLVPSPMPSDPLSASARARLDARDALSVARELSRHNNNSNNNSNSNSDEYKGSQSSHLSKGSQSIEFGLRTAAAIRRVFRAPAGERSREVEQRLDTVAAELAAERGRRLVLSSNNNNNNNNNNSKSSSHAPNTTFTTTASTNHNRNSTTTTAKRTAFPTATTTTATTAKAAGNLSNNPTSSSSSSSSSSTSSTSSPVAFPDRLSAFDTSGEADHVIKDITGGDKTNDNADRGEENQRQWKARAAELIVDWDDERTKDTVWAGPAMHSALFLGVRVTVTVHGDPRRGTLSRSQFVDKCDSLSRLVHRSLSPLIGAVPSKGMEITFLGQQGSLRVLSPGDKGSLRVLCDIGDLLSQMHTGRRPVVHGGIRPGRVFVTTDGGTGVVQGGWMGGQEWFCGVRRAPTAADDVHMLACLTLWALTGAEPHCFDLSDPARRNGCSGHSHQHINQHKGNSNSNSNHYSNHSDNDSSNDGKMGKTNRNKNKSKSKSKSKSKKKKVEQGKLSLPAALSLLPPPLSAILPRLLDCSAVDANHCGATGEAHANKNTINSSKNSINGNRESWSRSPTPPPRPTNAKAMGAVVVPGSPNALEALVSALQCARAMQWTPPEIGEKSDANSGKAFPTPRGGSKNSSRNAGVNRVPHHFEDRSRVRAKNSNIRGKTVGKGDKNSNSGTGRGVKGDKNSSGGYQRATQASKSRESSASTDGQDRRRPRRFGEARDGVVRDAHAAHRTIDVNPGTGRWPIDSERDPRAPSLLGFPRADTHSLHGDPRDEYSQNSNANDTRTSQNRRSLDNSNTDGSVFDSMVVEEPPTGGVAVNQRGIGGTGGFVSGRQDPSTLRRVDLVNTASTTATTATTKTATTAAIATATAGPESNRATALGNLIQKPQPQPQPQSHSGYSNSYYGHGGGGFSNYGFPHQGMIRPPQAMHPHAMHPQMPNGGRFASFHGQFPQQWHR